MATAAKTLTTLSFAFIMSISTIESARATDLASASIEDVRRLLAAKQLSCLEIAQDALRRIQRLDHRLKAFIAVNPSLLDDARRLDAMREAGDVRPLHCVTVAVKDNIDVRGLATTGGSVLLRGNRPAQDATAVQRLRDAGALIIGKTNLDELAVAGSTISSLGQQTRNAYDLERFAAGSSGGSAVAVATGMAACALGTETVNSLRNAASSAGVVAVRSTHGVVSRHGSIPLSTTMDVVGPICRSVGDAIRILAVISGRDLRDPATVGSEGLERAIAPGTIHPADLRTVKLGVLANLFGEDAEHEAVNGVMAHALDTLRAAGVRTVDIADREFDSDQSSRRLNVSNYEFRPLFEAYLSGIGPIAGLATLQDYYAARRFPESTMLKFLTNAVTWKDPLDMPEYLAALQYRQAMRAKLLALMDEHGLDALVYPAQKRPPLKTGDTPRPERNGIFASALGFPAIDLPAGYADGGGSAPVGLPIGMDLLGRPRQDARLLGLALAVERALGPRRAPAMAGEGR
ncbi:amidase [Bordetella petrii]